MLHWWLIPVLAVLWAAVGIFYLTMKYKGGTGIRSDGRTLVDKPGDEDQLPPP